MPSEQFEMLLDMIRARGREKRVPVKQARAEFEEVARIFPAGEDLQCQQVQAGNVLGEWISVPCASDGRVLFYLHGGGYVVGSLNTHRHMVADLSRAAAARVLSIEYRLAPEHPHPAALEDAVAAYRWLLSQGIDPARLVIAGDSAGGGLTVATLVALRDAGVPLPAAAVCLSPWVDLAGTGESLTTNLGIDPLANPEGLEWMAGLYAGEADRQAPLISPLYADLRGLPPLLIHVGTGEILLDDSVRLAERARAAGVEVVLDRWQDMVHVWHYFASLLPEGRQAIREIGEFIRRNTP